jgi:hypothetical protein
MASIYHAAFAVAGTNDKACLFAGYTFMF